MIKTKGNKQKKYLYNTNFKFIDNTEYRMPASPNERFKKEIIVSLIKHLQEELQL